ncbi:hypothetical protein HPP92_001607 [Vanilla planifolia]|uniref:Uncharacterized protein n=1 Tax=Vanilla planifolia TaxID=51239 RepID=A0A835VHQ0_VANPL|nr:hypothetical protein HPP92_001607 [Vanilla planifolia]
MTYRCSNVVGDLDDTGLYLLTLALVLRKIKDRMKALQELIPNCSKAIPPPMEEDSVKTVHGSRNTTVNPIGKAT